MCTLQPILAARDQKELPEANKLVSVHKTKVHIVLEHRNPDALAQRFLNRLGLISLIWCQPVWASRVDRTWVEEKIHTASVT